ncbi:4a-hydroxytetrahydrobiopterin dehydratase [Brachybacterium sp. EF45031]|uniref:4a-hydroxytetrahydrobiopterin dehydratase n=1 Tax=Brachybacterium sillae TaxID=2810536 RepID=UPI00217E5A35|nr:4a-hydroxytetrahydrobiopterin dehydratase [Brachybacterium sillae]MCS6710632.1 4a-hydroxytetrahydrobiopterin dehydratase [Brachybacterium sillae]
MTTLSGQALREALDRAGLDHWRGAPTGLHARFRTRTFRRGLDLVDAIGEIAEEMNHHPDITLTFTHVGVTLISHDAGGVTERDLRAAERISELARERDVSAQPDQVRTVELSLDTHDQDAIAPFWAAVLTGDAGAIDGDQIVDPTGQLPTLWFQPSEDKGVPPQRFHLDLWLGPQEVPERIRAAVAAGGTIEDDSSAPSFTVLADAQGNRVCLCTVAEPD